MPIIWVLVLMWSGTVIFEVSQPDYEVTWPFVVKDLLFIAIVLWAIFAEREIDKLKKQIKKEKRACSSKS